MGNSRIDTVLQSSTMRKIKGEENDRRNQKRQRQD
jgi:hypothetical protein